MGAGEEKRKEKKRKEKKRKSNAEALRAQRFAEKRGEERERRPLQKAAATKANPREKAGADLRAQSGVTMPQTRLTQDPGKKSNLGHPTNLRANPREKPQGSRQKTAGPALQDRWEWVRVGRG